MITAQIQTIRTNEYDYTSYKIQGVWYSTDKKGPLPVLSEGETVTFEAYDKPSKDGSKSYPTIKLATLRKVQGSGSNIQGDAPASSRVVAGSSASVAGTRDAYWSDKAKSDSEKDPRIAFFASYERALGFVDLAMRNGAFVKDTAWEKVKQTDKLSVLQKFVAQEAIRIMGESYAAKIPTEKDGAAVEEVPEAEENPEDWK